ncbi:hypothetical protein Tco_1475169 [Tanacetum coccineum]
MAPSDSLFLIFDVHYDGTFNFSPLRYENGLVYQWSVRKDNHLDLASVRDFLREKTQSIIMYELFFKLPQCELDVGLKIIENERDLEAMYDYAHEYGIIHVYITHGPRDLAPYYVENMCFYGSEDDVKSRRKTVSKDAGNMSVEELVSWVEEEAAMASKASNDDICVTSVLNKGKGLADKGKGLVDKDKGIMVDEGKAGRKNDRTKNSGIVIRKNVNPTISEDDDTDGDIDMEQRFNGSADLEDMYKSMSDSKSEYSDKSVDYLSEVSGCSRPNRVYDVGATHTVIEHEEYMDTLMNQLRGKGDDLTDPFTILENDQSTEKFSLWFYRSSKEMLITRCGRRPEKLKDIEKGKQRKQIKYPIGGRNEGSNCPFICYGRMMVTKSSFQVISLNEEHTCVRDIKYGNLVNYKWIAKHFGHKIRQNPKIKLHEIADLVLKKYKCIVS